MSIIEDTLRKMQGKQGTTGSGYNNSGMPVAGGNVSKNIKTASHRTFIIITIVLTVLGTAVYIGFDKHQKKLQEKQNILSYNLNTQIMPIVKTQKPLITTGSETKPRKSERQPAASPKTTKLAKLSQKISDVPLVIEHEKNRKVKQEPKEIIQKSEQQTSDVKPDATIEPTPETLKVKQGPKEVVLVSKQQTSDVKPEATMESASETPEVKQERKEVVFVSEQQKSEKQPEAAKEQPSESRQVKKQFSKAVKEKSRKKDITSSETTRVAESSQKTFDTPLVIEHEKEHKVEQEPKEVAHVSERQKPDWQHSVAGNTTLLVEEYVTEKQLSRAKHLVNIGEYKKAIEALKPVVDRSAGTWEAYLLMGAAYLGMGELYYAEAYLNMGIAMNGKQPQLWIQRAIVEQQRGEHEAAIEMLHEAEMLAPDMPKIPLNVGYSYDAIGEKELATKSYRSFLKLIEGNPTYSVVRLKVLERLTYLR